MSTIEIEGKGYSYRETFIIGDQINNAGSSSNTATSTLTFPSLINSNVKYIKVKLASFSVNAANAARMVKINTNFIANNGILYTFPLPTGTGSTCVNSDITFCVSSPLKNQFNIYYSWEDVPKPSPVVAIAINFGWNLLIETYA